MNILCFGNSESNPQRTFEKAGLLAKKQKFDCLLCLGDLFSENYDRDYIGELLEDKIEICIPTYFTRGASGLPKVIVDRAEERSGQVCNNLYYLGSSGRLVLSGGAKIGYCTGAMDDDLVNFTSKSMPIVDILLTQDGPALAGTAHSEVAIHCMPKYHFYNAAEFSEPLPYKSRMRNGDFRLIREIALAAVANTNKSKWFYAFKLNNTEPLPSVVLAARENPYVTSLGSKRTAETEQNGNDTKSIPPSSDLTTSNKNLRSKKPPDGYVCKLCAVADEHYFKDCPDRIQGKRRKRNNDEFVSKHIDPSSCFFCLSNPNLARHLIVSIGDSGSYLVLPKGGMTQNHVLILPVDHKPTLHSLGTSRAAVEAEMNQYILALEKMFETMGMAGIVFEISRTTGVHFHQQMMPIPRDKVDDLVDAFYAFSETENIALERQEPQESQENFFRVQFPSRNITLTGVLDPKSKFDLQFGRRVISDVMGVPERAHWKDCVRTDEQETADAGLFKEAFKVFDFTL